MSETKPSLSPDSLILGVDIGGTKTAVCLGTPAGEILMRDQFATLPERGPDAAMDQIAELAKTMLAGRSDRVHSHIGVSAPGPLSSTEGRFLNPPNNPSWKNFGVSHALEARIGRPVELMNDANAAAWAEWKFGAGRGSKTMVFFTMSTGMGAGLIIGGQLHEGLDDLAGEVGHTQIRSDGPVGFGRRGALEGFCSGPGIEQLCVARLHQARHADLDDILLRGPSDFRCVSMKEIGDAVHANSPIALDVFREVGERLGTFSAGLVDLLNPERLVLGTIGRIFFDFIAPSARRKLDELTHPRAAARVQILPAALGQHTGDLAAISAVLARRT